MGLIEELKWGAQQATTRPRVSVHEGELRHNLREAYGDLGRKGFVLMQAGTLRERAGSRGSLPEWANSRQGSAGSRSAYTT